MYGIQPLWQGPVKGAWYDNPQGIQPWLSSPFYTAFNPYDAPWNVRLITSICCSRVRRTP